VCVLCVCELLVGSRNPSGASHGFGHVTFAEASSAVAACQDANGLVIMGQAISVAPFHAAAVAPSPMDETAGTAVWSIV
jgi:hypothetical protein